MEAAGLQRRPGGTVIPTDVLVFAFLAVGVSAASSAAIGHEAAVVIFTVAWMSTAITRTAQFRRGERPALQLGFQDLRKTAILLLGSVPWVLLGFLQSAYPSSIFWKPIDVPPSLRALGIALAIAVIVEPLLNRLRWRGVSAARYFALGAPGDEYRFPAGVMIRSGAIMLLSGSPVFALLCALWLGAALWRPSTHRHTRPEWTVAASLGQPLQSPAA